MRVKLAVRCDVCNEELSLSTMTGVVACNCGEKTVSDIMDEEEYLEGWNSAYLRDAITDLHEGQKYEFLGSYRRDNKTQNV